jgi:hypothetical protein
MTTYRSLAANLPGEEYESFIKPNIWFGTFAYCATVDRTKFKLRYPEHQAVTHPKIVRRSIIVIDLSVLNPNRSWCGKGEVLCRWLSSISQA